MRLLIGGLAAAFVSLLALQPAPASAETHNCPLTTARRSITNTLPSGWFSTPIQSPLTEARIDTIGGQAHMVCVYGEAGRVMREVAADETCTARSGGFECASGSAPAPLPVSEAHSTGTFTARGTYNIDLDAGAESSAANADFWYEVIRANESYLTPRNGASYALRTRTEPSYGDCTGATYATARLRIESTTAGTWICVRTGEGRIGRFRIDSVDRFAAPRVATITHTTWR